MKMKYNHFTELKLMLLKSKKIVVFTGAGVSTHSGIPDYRSSTGIYSVDKEASSKLHKNSLNNSIDKFYEYFNNRFVKHSNAKPNKFHYWLSDLEKSGKLLSVVTQNVDGLHQVAGSKNVIELHGNMLNYKCLKCASVYNYEMISKQNRAVPICFSCKSNLRPDIVLYGEDLDIKNTLVATHDIKTADMLIIAGTSLKVYPAADLVYHFNGRFLVIINMEPTSVDEYADLVFNYDLVEVLKRIEKVTTIDKILSTIY